MTEKQYLINIFYQTGVQDCANVFDGDDVPEADELREAWTFSHADNLGPDEALIADELREAWVDGWITTARRYVTAWNERRAREEAADA
jgi:hypothetical protein